jgi:hypothetical protein
LSTNFETSTKARDGHYHPKDDHAREKIGRHVLQKTPPRPSFCTIFWMKCTAGCSNGIQSCPHDRSSEWPCPACGGSGEMPDSAILPNRAAARPAAGASMPSRPGTTATTGAHQPVGDVWMKCTAGCSNGIQSCPHDRSSEWPCTECRGSGRMLKRAAARPAASMPSPQAAHGAWNCGACTLQNDPRDTRCDACDAIRPIVPASEWECRRCTFINGANSVKCEMCDAQRTASSASASSTGTDGSKKQRTAGKTDECAVCFETIETRAALLPCGHAQFCLECATRLKADRGKCPVCNARIEVTQPIYMNFGRLRYKSRVRYMI